MKMFTTSLPKVTLTNTMPNVVRNKNLSKNLKNKKMDLKKLFIKALLVICILTKMKLNSGYFRNGNSKNQLLRKKLSYKRYIEEAGVELSQMAQSKPNLNNARDALILIPKFLVNITTPTFPQKNEKTFIMAANTNKMEDPIDSLVTYYRSTIKKYCHDPNVDLSSVEMINEHVPACTCDKGYTDYSESICNRCLIFIFGERAKLQKRFADDEIRRLNAINKDTISLTDDEIKGLRKELKLKDVIIADKTSSGKLIRKQNELLYNAVAKLNSVLRSNKLGAHSSQLEQKWHLIDLAKEKIAEEDFADSPKRQRMAEDDPHLRHVACPSKPRVDSVDDIVAKSASKVIADILETKYAGTETRLATMITSFNEDITAKIENITEELREHTKDEMIRMSKTATGDYRELLNYTPIFEYKINFKSRPTEVDREFFFERLYNFHHHLRNGHFTARSVIDGNAKWINYREAGTGVTLGNLIEFVETYNEEVRPRDARGRRSSGGNNDDANHGPGHGLDLDGNGDGNIGNGNGAINELDHDGPNGAPDNAGVNNIKIDLPGLNGSMTFQLPDVDPKDYEEPVRSFMRRFLQRRLRRMKMAAQIEEDILVMKAIRLAFNEPEDVPQEMRVPMPYGFHEYAKKKTEQESYLEYDGFETNTWQQKDE